jgi:hypothetical protein
MLPLFADHEQFNEDCLCPCAINDGSIKKLYFIEPINKAIGEYIVVNKHYLKRKAPCTLCYGLMCRTCNKIVGVIMYGISCSSTLLKGICGEDQMQNVYELTRLWINDNTPRNAESYLISNTIKLLDKDIIVSFAQIDQGHKGTIYQACNFLYCGLSTPFLDPKVKGMEHKHHATYAKGMSKSQIIERYGAENVYYVERPRKHRYIYIKAKGQKRKFLMGKLRYRQEAYPKE